MYNIIKRPMKCYFVTLHFLGLIYGLILIKHDTYYFYEFVMSCYTLILSPKICAPWLHNTLSISISPGGVLSWRRRRQRIRVERSGAEWSYGYQSKLRHTNSPTEFTRVCTLYHIHTYRSPRADPTTCSLVNITNLWTFMLIRSHVRGAGFTPNIFFFFLRYKPPINFKKHAIYRFICAYFIV